MSGGKTVTASFTVTNVGKRAGADVPQLYAAVADANGGGIRRLIGWKRIDLAPGESRRVRLTADARLLARFDEAQHSWHVEPGDYRIELGASSRDTRLAATARLEDRRLPP